MSNAQTLLRPASKADERRSATLDEIAKRILAADDAETKRLTDKWTGK